MADEFIRTGFFSGVIARMCLVGMDPLLQITLHSTYGGQSKSHLLLTIQVDTFCNVAMFKEVVVDLAI